MTAKELTCWQVPAQGGLKWPFPSPFLEWVLFRYSECFPKLASLAMQPRKNGGPEIDGLAHPNLSG
ncbi:MAG: hypothetical protein EBZ48_05905 [Proteobacteria bacterium]|nr:hypothetical protein [Pseudomonadota bacterium]